MSGPAGGGFATTRWSLVLAASRTSAPDARAALSQLCETYWPPLYAYARRRGYSIEDAQDLTQGFFARFLEKGDVEDANPQRGRFRAFLLTSFKHFLANQHDRDHARKRGGAHAILSLDANTAEAEYTIEPPDTLTPEALYERQWARGVLHRGLTALRAEAVTAGRESLFDAVKDVLVGDSDSAGNREIAERLRMTEGALRVTVHRLRRRLRELLRSDLLATVSDEAELDDEIQHLMTVWTAGDRRPGGV